MFGIHLDALRISANRTGLRGRQIIRSRDTLSKQPFDASRNAERADRMSESADRQSGAITTARRTDTGFKPASRTRAFFRRRGFRIGLEGDFRAGVDIKRP